MKRLLQLPLLLILFLAFSSSVLADQKGFSVTGTQYVGLEVNGGEIEGFGVVLIDFALPRDWYITYSYDRTWLSSDPYQAHDLSVSRDLRKDRMVTMGIRLKLPASGQRSWTAYTIFSWRWGREW